MSKLKSILIEFEECEANAQNIHPTILAALSAMRPPEPSVSPASETAPTSDTNNDPLKATTIWGLYANGVLLTTYLHRDTAEYDLHTCRYYEHEHGVRYPDDAYEYHLMPIPMHTHRPD